VSAQWEFVIANPAGGVDLVGLTHATGRRLNVRLLDAGEASCTLNGLETEAAAAVELASDLRVLRDGVALFRGRIGPSSDTLTVDTQTAEIAAWDYRQLLERRHLFAGDSALTATGVEQSLIAWHAIQATQARTGGNLAITRGAVPGSAVNRTVTFDPGLSVREAIDQIAQLDNGFEWEIGADGKFNAWNQRGADRGFVVDLGGTAASITRRVDPSRFANWLQDVDKLGDIVTRQVSDLATRPEGRWEQLFSDTALNDTTVLGLRADWLLAQYSTIQPAWTATLRRGVWGGPGDLWIGDTVGIQVATPRLTVDTSYRVLELAIELDDADVETVAVTFGDRSVTLDRRLRKIQQRLDALERP